MLRDVTCSCSWGKTRLPTITYWVDHLRFRSRAKNQPRTLNSPNQLREQQSNHLRSQKSYLAGLRSRVRDGDVDMRRNDRATSHTKLALSLGAAVMVALAAMFAGEAKAQTSGESLSSLQASIEPLRSGVTEGQVLAELARHNEERKAALHDYTVLRTYQVVDLKGKVHAEEIGRMEFLSPDKKAFAVTSESGSGLVRHMALNPLINS